MIRDQSCMRVCVDIPILGIRGVGGEGECQHARACTASYSAQKTIILLTKCETMGGAGL